MKLPRLNSKVALTDQTFKPSLPFSRQWDQVCTSIESISADSVTASADLATTGYITMKLSTGQQIKLAVVG